MKKIVFILVSLIIAQNIWSQNIDKNKLDNYFDTLSKYQRFMGSVSVMHKGKLIYNKSVGYVDFDAQIKANHESKYRIGSISKTFTAVLILKAVENKKLDLKSTIETYFPSLPNANNINISHLLYHRSGIPNFTDSKEYMTWNTQPKTQDELIQMISDSGSDFEPDTKVSYSNSNYYLLSIILEKVYKKNFGEILKSEIVKPLKLKNTYYGQPANPKENECFSYKFEQNWLKDNQTDMSIPLGAGGIVSTSSDLVFFINALFGEKILKKSTLETMKTLKDHYGMGLVNVPFYKEKGFGHTGGIDAFWSILAYYPKSEIAFSITSNASRLNNNDIAVAILSATFNKPFEIPQFKTIALTIEQLDAYTGTFASQQIPLKITLSRRENQLISQATGQVETILEAIDKDVFALHQAGAVFEFDLSQQTFILKQNGAEFLFKKE